MKSNFIIHASLIFLLLTATACASSGDLPVPTDSDGEIESRTATPAPPAIIMPSSEWNETQLKDLCLDISEIYDVPISYFSTDTHQNRAGQLLKELGFNIVSGPQGCDATLHITAGYYVGVTAYTSQPGDTLFDCVTGTSFSGLIVLTNDQHTPLYDEIHGEAVNEPVVVMDGCPDQETLFDTAWTASILESLGNLMGPEVITALFDSRDDIHRNAALRASAAFGPEDRVVVPALIEALNAHPDLETRFYIATGLQKIGPEAQRAASGVVPSLIDELQTSTVDEFFPGVLQQRIVETLGKLGPGARGAVPTLIEMLEDPDSIVTHDVIIMALGDIGPDAADAVPVLLPLARESDSIAMEALGKINGQNPEILSLLMEKARNYKGNPFASSIAMERLAFLHPSSPEVLPFLISAAQDGDPNVASNAILALGQTGVASPEVFSVLMKALSNPDENVHGAAASTLGMLASYPNADAEQSIPLLIDMIRNDNQYSSSRTRAITALGQIGGDSPEVIAVLAEAIMTTTSETGYVLETIGPRARPAVPALIDYLGVNQFGYASDIAGMTPYLRALISITGEYVGFEAQTWQEWWALHKSD
jgi:HEAT repeat protein